MDAQFVVARVDCAARRDLARAHQVFWNPTLLILHPHGLRLRESVGFLPPKLLVPELLLAHGLYELRRGRPGLAAEAFAHLRAAYPKTAAAPEALYWQGAAAYLHSGEKPQGSAPWRELAAAYPDSLWAAKVALPEANEPHQVTPSPFPARLGGNGEGGGG